MDFLSSPGSPRESTISLGSCCADLNPVKEPLCILPEEIRNASVEHAPSKRPISSHGSDGNDIPAKHGIKRRPQSEPDLTLLAKRHCRQVDVSAELIQHGTDCGEFNAQGLDQYLATQTVVGTTRSQTLHLGQAMTEIEVAIERVDEAMLESNALEELRSSIRRASDPTKAYRVKSTARARLGIHRKGGKGSGSGAKSK